MTTLDKITDYLSCLESGETMGVHLFTEAYPNAEVRAALFVLRYEGKIRMNAAGSSLIDWANEYGCEVSDFVEGDNETFISLTVA